ncbi:hypothetical protein [Burkholderia ubonensis]|uniref:hypothetical protein n=1 Tax=Burkholderia ubonensis TaxID=101571 RepID=UPI0012BB153E|nr:hypothetical protein [Burkholderia ubonensis]
MATVAQLLNAVYCAYLVRETVVPQPDLNLFSAAEVALHKCTIGGKITGKFDAPPEGQIAIQRALSTYEKQLVSIPARIVEAPKADLSNCCRPNLNSHRRPKLVLMHGRFTEQDAAHAQSKN